MGKIQWDEKGDHLYETGVDRGVLYLLSGGSYGRGYAWNGLTAVNESPSGGEPTKVYANNHNYLTQVSLEELGLTIEAYTYPYEFLKCLGKLPVGLGVTIRQQKPKSFGLSYRTLVGNDLAGNNYSYILHLVYGCSVTPSEEPHGTTNDSPDVNPFSWSVQTTPITVGDNTFSSIAIHALKFKEAGLANVIRDIEDMLYGTEDTSAELPAYQDIENTIYKGAYWLDSEGDYVLDSEGNMIETFAIT